MVKLVTTILFYLFYLTTLAQSELEKHICNIDGNTLEVEEITQNYPFQLSDELYQYLKEINVLFEQPYAKYTLMNAKKHKIAAAHVQLVGYDLARVITINKNYYSRKLTKSSNKKALFVWILSHELTHHINGDLYYDVNGIIANNFKKELFADQRAGYTVGMLTNVDISFFDEELPAILSSNPKSSTHPIIKYRIFAAKAGWLEAKLKESEHLNSCSRIYKKVNKQGNVYIGRYYNDNFNGTVYFRFKSSNLYFGNCANGKMNGNGVYFKYDSLGLNEIYLGQWVQEKRKGEGIALWTNGDAYKGEWLDNKRTGEGTIRWYNGNWYSGGWLNNKMDGEGTLAWGKGGRYEGTWKEGMKNGYGTCVYANGTKYRGQWLNDKKHGDGIFYKENKIIKAGCWKNDIYIGTECE